MFNNTNNTNNNMLPDLVTEMS